MFEVLREARGYTKSLSQLIVKCFSEYESGRVKTNVILIDFDKGGLKTRAVPWTEKQVCKNLHTYLCNQLHTKKLLKRKNVLLKRRTQKRNLLLVTTEKAIAKYIDRMNTVEWNMGKD